MQPLVSVIIPSYNCEKFIADTIESVLAQDYQNIELLVIDDGSTDNTQKIVKQYSNKLRLIIQPNSGVCRARNRGIAEAKGDFICLMDHDDYWYPDKISAQINAFKKYPEAGIVYSEFKLWYPNTDGIFPLPTDIADLYFGDDLDESLSGWIYHQLLLDCWVLTSTAMIRADLFNIYGNFDENLPYSEDWDLWLRFSNHVQFIKLKKTTTLYRQHGNQGNKKLRNIDYRTILLSNAKKKWGLCSRDNRCITEWQFRRQLAEYHASFGLNHLYLNGSFKLAIFSLLKAWLLYPLKPKYLAYIFAAYAGWRPKW